MQKKSFKYMPLAGTLLLIAAAVIWLSPLAAKTKDKETKDSPPRAEKIIVIDESGNRTTYFTDELSSSTRRTIEKSVRSGSKDLERISRLADALLEDLDLSGLTREVTRTLSEVRVSDFAAIADRALEDIDWEGINLEVDRTLDDIHRELNDPRLKKDMKGRLQETQEELELVIDDASVDIATAREELIDARKELRSIRAAKEQDENGIYSKENDNSYTEMLARMETEGLIDRNKEFSISKSGADLFINGQAQPDRVYNKYNKYLKEKNISIKGQNDAIVIELKK